MSTVTPPRGDDTDDQGRKGAAVVRATYAVTISGVSVIVLLTILSGCGEIGATAVGAIAAVGTIMTAAFGVAVVHLRRRH